MASRRRSVVWACGLVAVFVIVARFPLTTPDQPDVRALPLPTSDHSHRPGSLALPTPMQLSPESTVGELLDRQVAGGRSLVQVVLTGRVVDGRGHPWPGARVAFVPDPSTLHVLPESARHAVLEPCDPLRRFQYVSADVDGRFEVSGPWLPPTATALRGDATDPAVAITGRGMAWQVHPALLVEGRAMEFGDLVLEQPGGSFALRTVDEDGRVLPDVRVSFGGSMAQIPADDDPMPPRGTLRRRKCSTGPDGRFRADHLWPAMTTVELSKPGYVTTSVTAKVALGEFADLGDVTLARGLSITGQVRNGQGPLVSGARVFALSSRIIAGAINSASIDTDVASAFRKRARESEFQTVSEADGAFALEGFAHDAASVALLVLADGFALAHVLDVTPGTTGLDIALRPEARVVVDIRCLVEGTVIADGDLVGYARTGYPEVGFPNFMEEPYDELEVGAGRVVHRAGSFGTVLLVSAPGYVPQRVDVDGCAPGEERNITVSLAPGGLVTGRIVDDVGAPVADADVTAASASDVLDRYLNAQECRSAPDGRFVLDGLTVGPWELFVTKDGHVPVFSDAFEITSDIDEMRFVLSRGAHITGVVLDASGEPVAAKTVTAESVTLRQSMSTRSDRDGRFAFHGVRPGAWTIQAEAGGLANVDLRVGEPPAEVTLSLIPSYRLTGRSFAGPSPMPFVRVAVAPRDAEDGKGARSTRSGEDGRYSLSLPGPGEYRVTFVSRGNVGIRRDLVVAMGDVPHLDVDFGSSFVAGRVTTSDPRRLLPSQTRVRFECDGRSVGYATVDSAGAFSFGPTSAGRYTLYCHGEMSLSSQNGPIEVEAGETIDDIQLVLEPAARLRGFVKLPSGGEFRGFAHLRRVEGDGYHIARVSAYGFQFEAIEPGLWTLDLTDFAERELGDGAGRRGEPGVDLPRIALQQTIDLQALDALELTVTASIEGG